MIISVYVSILQKNKTKQPTKIYKIKQKLKTKNKQTNKQQQQSKRKTKKVRNESDPSIVGVFIFHSTPFNRRVLEPNT